MIYGILTALGTSDNSTLASLAVIFAIIALIVYVIIQGYTVDIIGISTTQKDEIPAINFKDNFVLGIKSFIVGIVYFIIPLIIIFALAYLTVGFDYIVTIVTKTNLSNIPDNIALVFAGSLAFIVVISVILFIIFSLVSTIAFGKLGKTGSLKEACSIGTVINETKEVGFLSIFGYVIVLGVIDVILGVISASIIVLIPIIGFIISVLIIVPYISMFNARVIGLIYSKV